MVCNNSPTHDYFAENTELPYRMIITCCWVVTLTPVNNLLFTKYLYVTLHFSILLLSAIVSKLSLRCKVSPGEHDFAQGAGNILLLPWRINIQASRIASCKTEVNLYDNVDDAFLGFLRPLYTTGIHHCDNTTTLLYNYPDYVSVM